MKKAFIAYSKADKEMVECLTKHLKGLEYSGVLETWYDEDILAGEPWNDRIIEQLSLCDIAIFCVSADLLANDYV